MVPVPSDTSFASASSSQMLPTMPVGLPQARPDTVHKVACIGGDGIGPEVIDAGEVVLRKLCETSGGALKIDFESFDWGSDRYKKTGSYVPQDCLATLRKFDAIL